MLRLVAGIVAGVVAWFVIVTILNLGLRYSWPEYHAVEKALTFTLPMMIARLSESGVSSLLSGMIATKVARDSRPALYSGLVLLAVFLPIHYMLFSKFPLWYHLTFLISLVILSVLGGRLAGQRGGQAA